MKKALFLFFILTSKICFSQIDTLKMPVNTSGEVEFSGIINCAGITKNNLFNNALQFVNKNYNDPKTVIKLSDREGGKLVVNTNFVIDDVHHVGCVLTIDMKDGKYRYIFSEFTHQVVIPSLTGDLAPKKHVFNAVFPNSEYKGETGIKLAKQTIDKIDLLIDSLKKQMSKSDDF